MEVNSKLSPTATYNAVSCREDGVLAVDETGGQLGLVSSDDLHSASMTAGLVQEYEHLVLPSIRPVHTLVLTVIAIVVCFFVIFSLTQTSLL